MTDGLAFTSACVNIVISPPPPTAMDDAYECPFGAPCIVPAASSILTNDSSPLCPGALACMEVQWYGTPSDGSLALNKIAGSFVWTPPSDNP